MATDRIALVTGTSTGFGFHISEQLARDGYTVFATMRDPAGRNAEPRAALTAKGITVLELDVTDQGSVDRLAATVLGSAGALDVLVNNAGTAHFGPLETFTPESVERQFATNVVGPHRLDRAFLPGMRARKSGLVVFVSSVVGRFVLPYGALYASSKWALEAQAEALSYELRPFGVDVAIVEPGAYATNIFNASIAPDDSNRVTEYGSEAAALIEGMNAALASSAGDPLDVAEAVLALARTPAGRRPLRTTVPGGPPADAINASLAPIVRATLENFGFAALLPAAPVPA